MKEQYSKYKRWELIIMIIILKSLKFFNGKVGEFILSFILVSLPSLLIFGFNPIIWILILPTHLLTLVVTNKLRSDEDKKEWDDELNREIISCKLALKQKKNK